MAADQRKKRVNASSLVGCMSREQNRVKRTKLDLRQHDFKMRPNISLEWDKKKKCVVSKREQICIPRRHLIPFLEPIPQGHNILADVLLVPQEIFELENLSQVLSYEVWQNHLSEEERSFLAKFLPREAEPDTTVRDLLTGDNINFGNPVVDWGTSLRIGELHPDKVLHQEQSLEACKKSYHSTIQKYHNDMIENLQTWKRKLASCTDPEVDMQTIWRSRKHSEKSVAPSETRFFDTEENPVPTPESCSWANSEKAYSSDNQNIGMLRGESQTRKGFLNKISDTSTSGLKVAAVSKKGEKVRKRNIQRGDGTKYMSYIKVSKEQHERVKSSMKRAGNGVQPRSLNNVLGSIDALNVQPYERFEEEESRKLHHFWLELANKDIPEGFATWRKRHLQRQNVIQSLGEEIEKNVELVEHQEKEGKSVVSQHQEKEGKSSHDSLTELSEESVEVAPPTVVVEGLVKEQADNMLQEQMDSELFEMTTVIENGMEGKSGYVFEEQTRGNEMVEEDNNAPEDVFIEDQNRQHTASLTNSPSVSAMTEEPKHLFLQDQNQPCSASLSNSPSVDAMTEDPEPRFLQDQNQPSSASLSNSPSVNAMTEEPNPLILQDQKQHSVASPNSSPMVSAILEQPKPVFLQDHNQQVVTSLHNSPRVSAIVEQPKPVFLQNHSQQLIPSRNNSPRVSAMVEPPKPVFLQDHSQQVIASHNNSPRVSAMAEPPNPVFLQDHSQQLMASRNNSPRVSAMVEPREPVFLQDQHQQQNSSLSGHPRVSCMETQPHGDSASTKTNGDLPIATEYPGNLNHVDICVGQRDPLSSASEVWSSGDIHGSYYQSSAANVGYASTQELSLGHPHFIQEQPAQILNLEGGRQDTVHGKDILQRESNDMSFLGSYSNEDRSELLQSLFKGGDSSLSYYHEQKPSGLQFQPRNDMMDAGQYTRNMREQFLHPLLPVDMRQKRLNDLYMVQQHHQNIHGNSMYSDGGSRFTIPRQQPLAVNLPDWSTAANVVRMTAPPSQPHLNGGELSQNWYMGENGARNGWPSSNGAVGVNHHNILGGGRSDSDQTLFSILSECNELRPGPSYDSVSSADRYIQSVNYSGIVGGIPSTSSSSLLQPPPTNPLEYLSGHEPPPPPPAAAGGLKINNLGWMGLPQQNSGLQETIGKPFLRSWNQ